MLRSIPQSLKTKNFRNGVKKCWTGKRCFSKDCWPRMREQKDQETTHVIYVNNLSISSETVLNDSIKTTRETLHAGQVYPGSKPARANNRTTTALESNERWDKWCCLCKTQWQWQWQSSYSLGGYRCGSDTYTSWSKMSKYEVVRLSELIITHWKYALKLKLILSLKESSSIKKL